jgi:hypothetical protein
MGCGDLFLSSSAGSIEFGAICFASARTHVVDFALSDVGRCHQQRLTLLFATRDQRSIAPMCCFATNLLHFPFKPPNAIRLGLT